MSCSDKHKESAHKWRCANRDRAINACREWRIFNPEKVKESNRKYHLANFEREYKNHRNWRLANLDKARESLRKWKSDNPEKLKIYRARRRAKKLSASGNGFTSEQLKEIFEEYNHRCVYCGSTKNLTIEHIEALNHGGTNDISNIVPACIKCNSSKQDTPLIIWMYRKSYCGIRIEE